MATQNSGLLRRAAEGVSNRRDDQERSAVTSMAEFFGRLAQRSAEAFGSSAAFVIAVVVVISWAVTGPFFGFSDTWQLVINTGTTIVTFLMVFLIQNAQNRDAKALHLKLDELIHSIHGARDRLINLENCTDEELAELQAEFARLAKRQPTDASN